jgi:uncharacterized membrane protein YkvA (DUF1232 family)
VTVASIFAPVVVTVVTLRWSISRARMGRSGGTPGGAGAEGKTTEVAGTIKDLARIVKRDAHALYLAARDPRTPWYAKALALCVAGYALSPIDLIPDFVPVLGYLDDVVIVPLGIWAVLKLIPSHVIAESRAAAARAAGKPVSRTAAPVMVLIWAASIALTSRNTSIEVALPSASRRPSIGQA